MDTLLQDLRYGARSLARSPAFTAVAVLALALGIGANSAVFSMVDGVLLRPLPYGNADRAVMLWSTWPGYDRTWLSEPEVVDYRSQRQVFDLVAPFSLGNATLTGDGEPERVRAASLSAEVLPALGVSPALGRNFTAAEDLPDSLAGRVALLSHALWQRRYAADPSIVGRSIQVGLRQFTVVGVLPDEFRLPNDFVGEPVQLYSPIGLDPNPDPDERGNHGLYAVARLAPGVTPARAQTAMSAFVSDMKRRHDAYGPEFDLKVVSARDQVSGDVRPALLVMLGAVALVLLVACANVANLLLARAEARHRELAIRAALGAGRTRIVRQLLAESLLLASAGAALGLVLAAAGLRALIAFSPPNVPRLDAIGMDGRVVAFTAAIAVLTSVVFGLVPALQASGGTTQETLNEGGRGASAGVRRQRVRRTLVVTEVALAMVLVVGAGLLIKSFARLMGIDAGVRPERVLTMELSLPGAKYAQPRSRAFYEQLRQRVAALPGVTSAGFVRELPFANEIGDWGFRIVGRAAGSPGEAGGAADWQVATPGYFQAMGIALRSGRYLEDADATRSAPVVVISEKMAKTFWPNQDPVGQQIRLGGDGPGPDTLTRTVVGVVADVRHKGLDAETKTQMYLPHTQFPSTDTSFAINRMSLVVRARTDPLALAPAVRREIRALDPEIPVSRVRSMEQVLSASASVRELNVMLLSVFAGVALTLAALGIYGVMAYTVTQRTKEIGVRMALGASAGEVQQLVLRQGLVLAGLGVVLGAVGAVALGRVLTSLLFGVTATDPGIYATVTAVLAAVALIATYVPARRATRVSPMVALRYE
jgi:putative ABC transport system permease protein